jgi:hypothetical protein
LRTVSVAGGDAEDGESRVVVGDVIPFRYGNESPEQVGRA